MKIALLGSAGSLPLAPHNDESWKIWGCSPGVYPYTTRLHAWFELHRWEPGTVGKPGTQKPWFSPEYVQWMGQLACPVYMQDHFEQIPTSRRLDIENLVAKYGSYFFTSSIAIMMACAIEDILEIRAENEKRGMRTLEPDMIGMWGVDMSANEEYGYQRAGCQHFVVLAADLGIQVYAPPESDLLRPMPVYGICEGEHWHIKLTAHKRELEARKAAADGQAAEGAKQAAFLAGALDELNYQMLTWGEQRDGIGTSFDIQARSPKLQAAVLQEIENQNKRIAEAQATRARLEAQSSEQAAPAPQAPARAPKRSSKSRRR